MGNFASYETIILKKISIFLQIFARAESGGNGGF